MALRVEIGEPLYAVPECCECCGRAMHLVYGHVLSDDSPCAEYAACWTEGHEEPAFIRIGIGRWPDETVSNGNRISAVVVGWATKDDFAFRVLDGDAVEDLACLDHLGPLLDREEALAHPRIDEVFAVVNRIAEEDPRINEFLLANLREE